MDGLDESSLLKARLLDAELRIAMLEGAILASHKAMKLNQPASAKYVHNIGHRHAVGEVAERFGNREIALQYFQRLFPDAEPSADMWDEWGVPRENSD